MKLLTAPDGSVWYTGRMGGVKTVKSSLPKIGEQIVLELPEPEPEKPKKPKHKTYKVHYTKPWEGTYGKFLNTFGNKFLNHYYTPDMGYGTVDPQILGNIYFKYVPEGKSWFLMTKEVDGVLYIGHHYLSLSLTPDNKSSWPNIIQLYNIFKQRIAKKQSPIKLTSTVKYKDPPPQPEPEVSETKKRSCEDPNCSWCNPNVNVESEKLSLAAKLHAGLICPFCHSSDHTGAFCKKLNMFQGPEWFYQKDNWTISFCLRCGSLEHEYDDCDYSPPPHCGYCGEFGHISAKCPAKTSSNKGGQAGKGNITVAPWKKRGLDIDFIEPPSVPWEQLWPIDNMEWDPLVENARLILLEFIAENVRHPSREAKSISLEDPDLRMVVQEGKERLQTLVDYVEPRLRAYTDMAVGGELRHHRVVGGKIIPGPGDRDSAWRSWKVLREKIGSDILLDAVVLFEDFNSNSYGGVKWGIPTKILWLRETGKITPTIFLDRVFDLEHNGGCFLNKIIWKTSNREKEGFVRSGEKEGMYGDGLQYDISYIKTWLGPARSRDPVDWTVILHFCPVKERELFAEYWERSNLLSRNTGIPPEETPRPRKMISGAYRAIRKKVNFTKAKEEIKGYFQHFGDVDKSHCVQCGKSHYDTGSYYCEDTDCSITHLYDPEMGYGLKLKTCTSHYVHCKGCNHLICGAHEFIYCTSCIPANPEANATKNAKYVKKGT